MAVAQIRRKDAPTQTTANARMRDSGRPNSAQGCDDPNDRILTNLATLLPAQQAGYYFFGAVGGRTRNLRVVHGCHIK